MTHRTVGARLALLGKYTLFIALSVCCVWVLFATPLGLHVLQSWLASKTTTVTGSPIIMTQLQALNRLETASQVSQQVVEASANRENIPAFLGQDRLLMQVQTEMIAGIDLARLTQDDVSVRGKNVTLRLPAPELFSVRIDDAHSKVFSRECGWLVFKPDVTLEGQARMKVLADARATGQAHLLPTARTNAEIHLRQLLLTMGFTTVEIRWHDRTS